MDGYSVTEAASVLGVPTERVWELLARGVLSGTPEGDTGMRVFLQPRPQPHSGDDPRRPNGDRAGPQPERELSPFRELLTEFRGLTERYGQALLALGEARGEVAALRSRVDVLEARMDLRLPMGTQSSAPWPAPLPPAAPPPVEHVAAPPEHAPPDPEHHDDEEHRARSRGPRRATDSFAEALARAEDPSVPELPPATPGEPHGALHAADAADAVEHGLPRELPPAEMVPVADEPEPGIEAHAEPEPEVVAEPMDTEAIEAEQPVAPEVHLEPVAAETQPAQEPAEVEEPVAVDVEPDPSAAEAIEVEPEPMEVDPPTEAELETPGAAVEAQAADAESEPDANAGDAEAIDFDANRYTTAIEEPDWFEAEAEEVVAYSPLPEPTASEAEPEPTPDVPAEQAVSEPEPEPEPEPQAEEPAPHEASAADEETVLWFGQRPAADSGADEMELAGTGAPPPSATDGADTDLLPGSRELDEALASLEELTRRTRQSAPGEPDEWPPASTAEGDEPYRSAPGPSSWAMPVRTPFPGSGRPGSPATRAYRRLRRIFPG